MDSWIHRRPVPPPILTYICSATSANCVCVQSDAPNRFVLTTAAFRYMTLQQNSWVASCPIIILQESLLMWSGSGNRVKVNPARCMTPAMITWKTWRVSSELLVCVLRGGADARTPPPSKWWTFGGYSYPQIMVDLLEVGKPSRNIIVLSETTSTGVFNLEQIWNVLFSISTMLKYSFMYFDTVHILFHHSNQCDKSLGY